MRPFPNPTSGDLNIQIAEELVGDEFSVYDISGRMILNERFIAANYQLSTANLYAGIYFVRVANAMRRFIKF